MHACTANVAAALVTALDVDAPAAAAVTVAKGNEDPFACARTALKLSTQAVERKM